MAASEQLEMGELWKDMSGLIQCSCVKRGPVLVSDRRIDVGLIERVTRCEGCGSVITWRMSAPKHEQRRRAVPLLNTMERGR